MLEARKAHLRVMHERHRTTDGKTQVINICKRHLNINVITELRHVVMSKTPSEGFKGAGKLIRLQ